MEVWKEFRKNTREKPVCPPGDITSRLSSDTTQVSDLISQNVNMFLKSLVQGIGFFIFMFGISWKLALVTIMGFPFIAVISNVYGEYYKVFTLLLVYTHAQACTPTHAQALMHTRTHKHTSPQAMYSIVIHFNTCLLKASFIQYLVCTKLSTVLIIRD